MTITYTVIIDAQNDNKLIINEVGTGIYTETIIQIDTHVNHCGTNNSMAYKVEDQYIFLAGYNNLPSRIVHNFLQDLSTQFFISNNISNSTIEDLTVQYSDVSNDKIVSTRRKVDEVIDTMTENIDILVNRGDNLDHLQKTADRLDSVSYKFNEETSSVRCYAWKKNMKTTIFLILCILCLLIMLAVIIYIILK